MDRIRHGAWPLALLLLGACGGEGGETPGATEGEAVAGTTAAAADGVDLDRWNVDLDQAPTAGARFEREEVAGGFGVSTGPAGITWRSADRVPGGDFSVSAELTQRNAPVGHREGYGILVGGRELGQEGQQYTYFLVRGDGRYLVKRREGTATRELTDWVESPAVRAVTEEGEAVGNALEIRARGDQVEFVLNGTVVETFSREQVQPEGLAGVRVNHDLDVEIQGWGVRGGPEGA